MLQVPGAQFRPGPFPAETGGPAALALTTRHSEVLVGDVGESLRGVLEPSARRGDRHRRVRRYVARAGRACRPRYARQCDRESDVGVVDDFPARPFILRVAASDEAGRFGVSATTMLVANDLVEPPGELVFGLHWDSSADLDLHVVDLNGEAWSDDPNTYQPPPPGEPADPLEYMNGGILDHDGNKGCHRDGRPNEHIVWTKPPPAGEYVVRVDARSMCKDASAAWRVEVHRNGELQTQARGVATPDDVLQPHGAGAGRACTEAFDSVRALAAVVVLTASVASAQPVAMLRGRVVDRATKLPVAGAVITIGGELGHGRQRRAFSISLAPGRYIARGQRPMARHQA